MPTGELCGPAPPPVQGDAPPPPQKDCGTRNMGAPCWCVPIAPNGDGSTRTAEGRDGTDESVPARARRGAVARPGVLPIE